MSRALYALNTHRHVQYTVRTSMRVHADLKAFPPTRIISINKMGPFFTLCNLPLAVLSLSAGVLATSAADLPTVDLGYMKHRALSYNVSFADSVSVERTTNSIAGDDRHLQRNGHPHQIAFSSIADSSDSSSTSATLQPQSESFAGKRLK